MGCCNRKWHFTSEEDTCFYLIYLTAKFISGGTDSLFMVQQLHYCVFIDNNLNILNPEIAEIPATISFIGKMVTEMSLLYLYGSKNTGMTS